MYVGEKMLNRSQVDALVVWLSATGTDIAGRRASARSYIETARVETIPLE